MTLEKFMMKPPYARPINLMKSLKKSGQAPPLPFLLPVLCEPCICLFALKKKYYFPQKFTCFFTSGAWLLHAFFLIGTYFDLLFAKTCKNAIFSLETSQMNQNACCLFLNVVLNFFCKLINYAHKKFPSKFIHWLDTNPLSNWIAKKDWKMFTFKHNFFLVFW